MQPITHNHPTNIVILGGTGDLAKTKLFPALLDLYANGQLPQKFGVIGLSRKDLSDTDYQQFVHNSLLETDHKHTTEVVEQFCEHFRYVAGSFEQDQTYEDIKSKLTEIDNSIGQCTNKLFYLAVPPQFYETIFEHLHASEALALCDGIDSWSRLLVEKPFGRDLRTAQALEKKMCSLFADEQIYRIDHYLAKDSIENIIALRFVNTILADSWHGEAIESMHIKLLETKDVSNRGSFYDDIGTLRDVGQNHMLQIFALLTMPAADVHDPQAIRAARAQAIQSLQKHTQQSLTRGQYKGYADTHGVDDNSNTETYFKLSFNLDEGSWQNTTFTLEAGKALDTHVNEAVITFKSQNMCSCAAQSDEHEHKNRLSIKFAPDQQITLSVWTKTPGFDFTLQAQKLTLAAHPGQESASSEAYERVLFDCITGDQTRFVSSNEVELAWQFITPILEQFKHLPLHRYDPGTAGPTTTSN